MVASGTGPLTYQWYQGTTGVITTPVVEPIARSFTTPALTVATNYWVRVSESLRQADSATAAITIQDSSTTTVTFEAGPYTYRGTPFTATAVATGAGGLNQPVPS